MDRQTVPLYNSKRIERILVVILCCVYLSKTEGVTGTANSNRLHKVLWKGNCNKVVHNFIK